MSWGRAFRRTGSKDCIDIRTPFLVLLGRVGPAVWGVVPFVRAGRGERDNFPGSDLAKGTGVGTDLARGVGVGTDLAPRWVGAEAAEARH